MKNPNKFNIIVSVIFLQFFLACKKMVEIDPPKNQLVTTQVFADSTNATAAVLGMYVRMINTSTSFRFANGGITLFTGLTSDELYSTTGDATESEFYTNSIMKENGQASSLWTDAYRIINQANSCLEGLSASDGIKNETKDQLTGEAKLVRAFIYFNLLNLYGEVPFVNTTDYNVSSRMPRMSKDSIYQKIIEDLSDARQLLSTNYATSQRVRPNRFTALALLSRVLLYQGSWSAAESIATEIINSNIYRLSSNLNDVFLAGSIEAIWQLPPAQAGFETAEGNRMIPTSPTRRPRYPISNSLLNTFESGDNRKPNWLKANTVSGQLYYYPFKYKLGFDGNTIPVENYMIFRLAEQYLIRAEARAQQNNLLGAVSDLNIIRKRSGLANTTANDQVSILNAILHERQVELFCEWGHRWYDLKRTNKADALLGIAKAPNWQATDALFPIPFTELSLNTSLTQNPGY